MFKTMQRQLHREQPKGKALVIRRIIISSIFIATFFVFQMLQLNKVGPSLDTQYDQITAATQASKENAEGQLQQFEKAFPGAADKLYSDKAFSESPLSDRLPASIKFETRTAQQESSAAHGNVILFDIFQFVLPGAVNMVNDHDQKLANFFNSDDYKTSVEANEKVIDLNTAIQYCKGTPLALNAEKMGYGYAEAEGKYLTQDQREARANAIYGAADRTICADIPKTAK